ncbi:hypothetical protein OPV22_000510 [Ensete ventricosum]|uniref:Uncharacterized protein n=1 Tax=Ensete ventricosum TaxID=4639 RepID=A0AAV8QGD9_ENSVE|nr:hypothetical protein OPV22_000510 [Ensete ventricosum]
MDFILVGAVVIEMSSVTTTSLSCQAALKTLPTILTFASLFHFLAVLATDQHVNPTIDAASWNATQLSLFQWEQHHIIEIVSKIPDGKSTDGRCTIKGSPHGSATGAAAAAAMVDRKGMASLLLRLLLLISLALAHLIAASHAVVPPTGDGGTLGGCRSPSVVGDAVQVMNEIEEAKIQRMDVEINDYPGSGANDRHTPKPPE